MSNLVTNKIQVGQSPTPANNMVWEVDPVTGVLILRRGTLGVTGNQILKFNSDGGVALNQPAFKVYRSTGTNISSSYNKVSMDVITFDTNNCFNNTAATVVLNGLNVPAYSFMPNVAGYYHFTHMQSLSSPSEMELGCVVYKGQVGGAAAVEEIWAFIATTGRASPCATGLVYMDGKTDYVQAWTYASGTGVTINTGTDKRGFFCGHLVRAA